MTTHITAEDIINWSSKSESSGLLPVLIRRLIHSTANSEGIQSIDFPSDKSTSLSGYDGILEYQGNISPWIPSGKSVWELSTQEAVKTKANDDFEKRTKNPLEMNLQDTIYVGISTRRWKEKNNWKESKKTSAWKEVRFYDADDLSQWLELSFAASLWFAAQIGHPLSHDGVSLLERHWEGVTGMVRDEIHLTPELFTNFRKQNVETLVSFLKNKPKHLDIESDSDDAVLDFITAVIVSMGENEKDIILSKTLILDQQVHWDRIVEILTPLILIVKSSLSVQLQPQQLGLLKNKHLIRIAPAFRSGQGQYVLKLSRFIKYKLHQQLIQVGYNTVEAEQLAHKSGGSGTNLRNLISEFRIPCQPEERNVSLRPFVWIGGWLRNSPNDQEIVKQLSKKDDYEQIESLIFQEKQRTDSLFYVDSEIINLYSKYQAWHLFSNSITRQEFENFLAIAVTVLSERNPKYDLTSDKQWMANVYGKTPKYSNILKKNIAETMACLASLYDTGAITFPSPAISKHTIQHKFDDTIIKILHSNMTMEEWASIDSILVLLAETSPDSFIKAVRNELKKTNNSVFVQLMYDDGGVTSPCKHAGLLRALEMLAVSKDHHKDAIEILFSLMEIDPGGKWGNRPKQTLRDIYCWWHLRSDIDLQSRITVLNNLLETKENLVWNMLFHTAFQSHYTTVMDPTFPHWRNWGLEINEQNAERDGFAFRQFCAEQVLDKIGTDYIRWQKILKHSNIINKSAISERFWNLLNSLEKNIPLDWTDTQREQLVGILRELLSIDMIRSEENKIFSEDTKKHLVDFMNSITPEDIVLQNAWLFSYKAYEYFYNKFDSVKNEQWYRSNADAVKQIIKQYNFDGLKNLINIAEEPFLIGKPLADQYGDQFFSEIIPTFLESENEKEQLFASAYLRHLCQGKREIWEQKYQSEKLNPLQWKSNTAIVFLNSFCYGKELWYWVDNFDESVQREFWTKQHGYYEYEWDNELMQFVYEHLVRFQNYDAALKLAISDKNKKYNITVPQKLFLLQNIAQQSDTVSHPHDIIELFMFLQKQFSNGNWTEEEQLQLARLELQFIPLLYQYSFYRHEDCSPKILISYILKSAEFFVVLLRYAFCPNPEENPDYTEDELPNAAQIAGSVYKLLENLNQLPGEINGVIDSEYLCDWIQKSRELARMYARMNMCDLKIGQLFARCSNQTLQGQMPRIELVQILEDINSKVMLEGFSIGLFNNRSVTVRNPFDGGQQERDIASIYSEIAGQTKIDYPHVSNVFDQLAIRYTKDALREDEQAQQRKIL